MHVMTCPGQVEIVVPGTWDQNLFIDDDSPVGDSFSSGSRSASMDTLISSVTSFFVSLSDLVSMFVQICFLW